MMMTPSNLAPEKGATGYPAAQVQGGNAQGGHAADAHSIGSAPPSARLRST